MRNFLLIKSLILVAIVIKSVSAEAQMRPMIVCNANSLSPSVINADYNPQDDYLVHVYTNGCTNYTVTENLSWLSYAKAGLWVTITVNPNTGSARSGNVTIGGMTLQVNQACGNFPAAAGTISGTATVCTGQNGVAYSVGIITGATGYDWNLPSGATIASGSNTNSITVNYSANAASGNITVRGINSCSYGSYSPDFAVTVNQRPTASAGSNSPVCEGQTINLTSSGGSTYSWTGPNSFTSNTQNPSRTNATTGMAGTYTVTVTNAASCSAIATTNVSINSLPVPTISGVASACLNSTGNVYTTEAGKTNYSWRVTGGSKASAGGSGDNTVTITWTTAGTGHVKVNYTNAAGCTAAVETDKPVTVNSLPSPTISGAASVCSNSAGNVYTTQPGMSGYSWTVTGYSMISGGGSNDNTVTVKWGIAGTGHVKVNYTNGNNCTAASQTDYPVTINPLPIITIAGSSTVCANSTGNVYTTQSGMSGYSWTVIGGHSTAGGDLYSNTITITWEGSGTGHVKVNYTNSGGCTAASQTDYPVTIKSLPTPSIIGSGSACLNSSGNLYETEDGKTGYLWTVEGGSITSGGGSDNNYATITWDTMGPGHVKVNYVNGNGCMAVSQTDFPVTMNLLPVPSISGPMSVCSGSAGNIYTTTTGKSNYLWTLTGGSITSGGRSTDDSVTVAWGIPGSGHVKVSYTNSNGCTAASKTDNTVTINALPVPSVSGLNSVCPNSDGNVYTTTSGMHNYVWSIINGTLQQGGGSNDNTVTIHWGSSGTGHVKVNYTDGSGCTATRQTDYPVNIVPSIAIQPVNSTINQNEDASFSVSAIGPNLQYQWESSSTGSGSWTNLTGAPAVGYNTSSLTIQGAAENMYYRCEITSGQCTVYSNSAKLSMNLSEIDYMEGSEVPVIENRQLNTSLPVGSLPGEVNVNDLGAATYVVPIFTSPGTAGMKPEISIVYNSMTKDGLLGKGWDLAGLSSIERVPQDFYHDSQVVGIKLQNTDKFALDSNRLVLSSGTYGSDGSIYETEIQSFVQVTAKESAGNGPSWFEVKTKDGKTIEYGNTASSKVEATGSSTVYKWRVNKITDQNGNYITFSYIENSGESLIDMIQYTGSTEFSPYNTIKFTYGTKPTPGFEYIGGSKILNTAILTSIRMITENNALVREYQFKYVYDLNTYLREIIEFGSDNTSLNSTIIQWGAAGDQFIHGDSNFSDNMSNIFYHGDFNGDGRMDFVVTERKTSFTYSDTWRLYLASSNGVTFNQKNWGYLSPAFKSLIVTDADGNGSSEIFMKFFENASYQCNPHLCGESLVQNESTENTMVSDTSLSLNSGNGILLNPPPSQDTCWDVCYQNNVRFLYYVYNEQTGLVRGSTSKDLIYNNSPGDLTLKTADLDGNGITDYIVLDQYNQLYRISGVNYQGTNPYLPDLRIIDFDGDKRDELLVRGENALILQYDPSTEDFVTLYSSSTFPSTNDRIYTGDFNGDKKTDILSWNNGWTLKFSTGTGFESSSNVPALTNTDPEASLSDNNIYISDINGDKKDDIVEVYLQGNGSKVKTFFSLGDGTFASEINDYSQTSINHDYISFGDSNGDGKQDLFYNDYSSASNPINVCFFRKDEMKHLVSCIANGLNNKTWIYYSRLNKSTNFYTRGTGAQFPVVDFNGAFYAVDSTKVHDNIAFINKVHNYSYEGLRLHKQGKGILGFQKITSFDNKRDSLYTWREYGYDPTHFFTYPSRTSVWFKNNSYIISEVVNTFSTINFSNNVVFPYLSQSLSTEEYKGISTLSTYGYDNWGNMISNSTEYRTGTVVDATNTVTNQFESYGNYGIANKLTSSTTTSVYGSEPSFSRSVEYTYNNNGNLLTEITDPAKAKAVTKTYSSFNSNGLPEQVTISANSLSSRTNTLQYDPKSRFVLEITNPLSHSVSKTYDPGSGNLLTDTGIDDNTTSYQYDGFGRLKKTTTPRGIDINTSLFWDENTDGGENSEYYTLTSSPTPGKPDQYVYYDMEGHKLWTKTDGLDGQISQVWDYSPSGDLTSVVMPFKTGDPIKVVNYNYDFFGRVQSENNDGLITRTSYNDNNISEYNPAGQVKTSHLNSIGNVVQVIDYGNSTINYTYHSSGQIKNISTAGTTISFVYDDYGRKTSVTNPNAGTTSYIYNAFGELISQTDANNNTYTFQYDLLGRMTQKSGPEGITTYTYKNSGNGIEKPDIITGPNSSISYSYNNYGQALSVSEIIPSDQTMTTSFSYDNSWGNNSGITYPSGLSVTNIYNDDGYLTEIKNSANQNTIWELDYINALGQPVQYSLGSSDLKTVFRYDDKSYLSMIKTGDNEQSFNFNSNTGNLSSRSYKDNITLTENFTYDNLNRLTSYRGSNSLQYDDNGNITSKSDAGTYSYDGSKVNALTAITGNGGTISDTAQYITYTGFNMTASVSEQPYEIQFTYGPDNQRVKSVLDSSSILIKTKYYSTSYEKEVTGSKTREITYINSPYGLVAVVIKENTGSDTLFYVETDQLGSIIGLVRTNGTYKERYSYDAWGRRRNPGDWTYTNVPKPAFLDRGYTGHEHLSDFGLINMNGRMYDPVVARFLGVDPVLQDEGNSQSYNGYSYCLNNPIRYSDPTGYTVYQIPKENWLELINDANNGASVDELAFYVDGGGTYSDQGYLDFLNSTYASGGNDGWWYTDENRAYNYMWLASKINKVEYGAYICHDGVFVLPIMGRSWDNSEDLRNTKGRTRMEYYKWGWNYDNNFYFNGPEGVGTKEVLGFIHTHPDGDPNSDYKDNQLDDDDFTWSQWAGVPIFVMSNGNYFEGGYADEYRHAFPVTKNVSLDDVINIEGSGIKLIPILEKFHLTHKNHIP